MQMNRPKELPLQERFEPISFKAAVFYEEGDCQKQEGLELTACELAALQKVKKAPVPEGFGLSAMLFEGD